MTEQEDLGGVSLASPPQSSTGITPNLKRESEDQENGDHGPKRQKFSGPRQNVPYRRNPMNGLQRGLEHLVSTSAFSEEVQGHAKELLRLLYNPNESNWDGYVLPSEESTAPAEDQDAQIKSEASENGAKNPHTNVPPPFAVPDPTKFAKGPVPQLDALDEAAPSLANLPDVPGMPHVPTTAPITPPFSNTMPAAPEITDVTLHNAPYMHTSALPAYVQPTGTNSYEHLEFLGDAYLEVIATRLIHARFPLHTVGQKAGLRELLVKNETLAEYSRAYQFGERVQSTQIDRSGATWTKILADVFEAYLACVIIQDSTENGFLTAERWLTELWAPKILQWRAAGDGLHDTSKKADGPLDAKTDLNRLLVGKESKLEYREEKPMQLIKEGNRTVFYMGVYLTGWGFQNQHLGSGEGRSKQIAGTAAAEEAIRSSQDIIQLAHQRKAAYERQFKKSAVGNRGGRGRGNRGGGGFGRPHSYGPGYPATYGQQAAPGYGQAPAYGQSPGYGQAAPPWGGQGY